MKRFVNRANQNVLIDLNRNNSLQKNNKIPNMQTAYLQKPQDL